MRDTGLPPQQLLISELLIELFWGHVFNTVVT